MGFPYSGERSCVGNKKRNTLLPPDPKMEDRDGDLSMGFPYSGERSCVGNKKRNTLLSQRWKRGREEEEEEEE